MEILTESELTSALGELPARCRCHVRDLLSNKERQAVHIALKIPDFALKYSFPKLLEEENDELPASINIFLDQEEEDKAKRQVRVIQGVFQFKYNRTLGDVHFLGSGRSIFGSKFSLGLSLEALHIDMNTKVEAVNIRASLTVQVYFYSAAVTHARYITGFSNGYTHHIIFDDMEGNQYESEGMLEINVTSRVKLIEKDLEVTCEFVQVNQTAADPSEYQVLTTTELQQFAQSFR